jgi:predicted MFS family arabinose efflux permease
MKKFKMVCIIMFLVFSAFLVINWNDITWQPWNNEQPLEWLGYASGNEKLTAIIADGAKTVLVLNESGELVYRIRSRSNAARSFVSAELVDLDDENNLYVYDKNFGGAFEENSERVLKYSPAGTFMNEIYTYTYKNEDFIITKGKISGMASSGNLLYLARLEHEGFYLEQVSTAQKNEPRTVVFVEYPEAFRELSYCRINVQNQRILWTTKSYTIVEYDFSGRLINEIPAEDGTFPYMSTADNNNNLIYTDIVNSAIVSINTVTGERTQLFNGSGLDSSFYYYINYKSKIYASYNADDILLINDDGTSTAIDSYTYSKNSVIIRYVFFSIGILTLILFLVIVVWFILFLSKQTVSALAKQIILVGICILFGAGISSIIIIRETQKQYNDNTYNGLENISRLIASSIDMSVISNMKSPAEFDSPEYKDLSAAIKSLFLELQFEGKQVYLDIWMERDGKVYSMYDLEYALGAFYFYSPYEGSFLETTYDTKQYDYSTVHTSSGTWVSVTGPILDNGGNVTGAIEIGYNMRMVEKESRAMILQTSLIVLATTVAFLLIIIECMLILDAYRRNKTEITGNGTLTVKPRMLKCIITLLMNAYQKNRNEEQTVKLYPHLSKTILYHLIKTYKSNTGVSFHPELLRAAVFFMYFSANFATALLPMYAAGLYVPFLNLPREFIVTLPFIAQVICVVIALILIPLILEKAGIKKISFIAAVLFFAGNALCFIAVNILHLSLGYALIGFSGGTFVLIFNTIIGGQKKTEEVNSGFAHFNASYLAGVNVGVICGSIIAQFFSHRIVFCFASGMSLLFLGIIIFSLRSKLVRHMYDVHYTRGEKTEKFALLKFLLRPVVIGTLVLLLLPYVVSMSFTEYFMPFFGTEHGLGMSNIGQLILLSGLFAILFGTSLCEHVSQKVSMRIIIIFSLLLDAGAIYLFSLNTSIGMLVITIVLLAVANIFALTNIQTYFTTLYQGKKVASIAALSAYSAVENISMAIGPVVFSYILAGNIAVGMKIFACVMTACLVLFVIISGFAGKRKAAG